MCSKVRCRASVGAWPGGLGGKGRHRDPHLLQIVAERAVASSRLPCATTLEPVSTEDLPLQVDILEAVRQSMQTYKALYIGSLPVPRAMGMDVLNKAIEKLTRGPGREHWMPSLIHVSDTAMRVHPAQEDEEAAHIWECQVRYVTFLGVGRDAHTFALIVDTGRCFQCTAFWCEPDAGTISEAVQAACMVQYQKCLVAAAPAKVKGATGRGWAGPTATGDAATGAAKASGSSGGAAGPGARRRGLFSLLEAFRLRRALLHSPASAPASVSPAGRCLAWPHPFPAPHGQAERAWSGVTWRNGGALREAGEPGARLERPPPVLLRAAGAGQGSQASPAHPPGPRAARGGSPRCPSGAARRPRCAGAAPAGARPAGPAGSQRGAERGRGSAPGGVRCARRRRARPAAGGPGRLPSRPAETSVRRHRAPADGAGGRVGSGEAVSPGEEEDGPPGARAPGTALGHG
uniref:PID domain-containing protein n=1 Tax=Falco tinnunculus TaxID=100819 RepID=A0A8C4UYB2_FALTI